MQHNGVTLILARGNGIHIQEYGSGSATTTARVHINMFECFRVEFIFVIDSAYYISQFVTNPCWTRFEFEYYFSFHVHLFSFLLV